MKYSQPHRGGLVILKLDWRIGLLQFLLFTGILFSLPESAGSRSFEKGMTALKQERVQAAVYHFKNTVKEEPGNGVAWLHLAEVLVDLGRLEESEKAYRLSMEQLDTKTAAHVGLAGLLRDLGRTEKSLELLQKALESDPDSGPAHVQMALLMEKLKKPDQALEHYSKAISAGTNDHRAFYRIAILYSSKGESRQALNHLQSAFEQAPDRYVARVVNSLRKVRNDFEQIRYLPEFQELLDQYKEYWPESRSSQ